MRDPMKLLVLHQIYREKRPKDYLILIAVIRLDWVSKLGGSDLDKLSTDKMTCCIHKITNRIGKEAIDFQLTI